MLIETVKDTVKKHRMLERKDKVVVCVSGGPDSVALLHALLSLREEMGIVLYLAHLNHKFRQEESDKDQAFVEQLAAKLNLPITAKRVDVPRLVKEKGVSAEEGGREARYEFFFEVARSVGSQKIALGHTKDDQAETVLMRILRGCGLLGLCGIPATREMEGTLIIRPLIEVWRKEIDEFLEENGISFRHDSSNFQPIYFRNRIRSELLPLLEKKYNPNIKEGLANLAENSEVDYAFLEKVGKRKFRASSKVKKNAEVVVDLKRFNAFPKAIQRLIARQSIETLKGDLRRITYQHWKELDELISMRPAGSQVDLPRRVSVLKQGGKLIFYLK